MSLTSRQRLLGTAAALVFASPLASHATNGYFSHGYSSGQIAMGGAGTALPTDAMTVSQNPAGLSWTGNRTDFVLSFFRPYRDYTASELGPDAFNGIFEIDAGRQSSKNSIYYIPAFALSREIDETTSWGLAVYGNGGLNTEYTESGATFGRGIPGFTADCDGAFGGGPANGADLIGFCGGANGDVGVDLIQLFVQATLSYKLSDSFSVGFSPIFAAQRFRAFGLEAFARFSNEPDQVTGQGLDHSYGGGARVGFLWDLFPGIGLGASYQSRIWTQGFDKYDGLFASKGNFDIPSNWNVGVQLHPFENHRLVVDFQRIYFGEIDSVGNEFDTNDFVNNCALPRLLGNNDFSPACLGASTGPGFGWRNINVYKAGYQGQFGPVKARLGYSYTKSPIKDDQVVFNILAPAVPQHHVTGGFSYQMSKRINIDVGVMYAFNSPVTGKNPLSNTDANIVQLLADGVLNTNLLAESFGADPDDQDIRLGMHQIMYTLGVGYRF